MKVLRMFNANNEVIASQKVGNNITEEQIQAKIKFLFGDKRFFIHYKLMEN